MQTLASLLLIFAIYFLGCLALIQEFITPQINDSTSSKRSTNYLKIIIWSASVSSVTSMAAYYLFLIEP